MRRHRFDPISAMFGVFFVAIGTGFLSDTIGFSEITDWIGPSVVLLIGMSFVFRALSRGDEPEPVVAAAAPVAVRPAPEPHPLTDAELVEEELRRELRAEAEAARRQTAEVADAGPSAAGGDDDDVAPDAEGPDPVDDEDEAQ